MPTGTKCLLRKFCKYVYYAGTGNFWYEGIYEETVYYRFYSILSFSIYVTMILLENLAAMFGSFPEVEKNSAVMFAAIHNIVLAKMFLLLYHKNSIRKLNYQMASVMENIEDAQFMKNQYWRVKYGILFYVVSVYLSLIAYGVESLRRSLFEDTPFYTVVTFLPYYEDNSTAANVFRVFFYMTWLYMMLPMMSADCMPIVHLITMTYKFATLVRYYGNIRKAFDVDVVSVRKTEAVAKLKSACLEGILMHNKLMFLSEEIHRVFGIIMSLQVCESSAVAVLLLLRLATIPFVLTTLLVSLLLAFIIKHVTFYHIVPQLAIVSLSPHMNVTNALMTYTFVGSLFFLLALNLWNAGEITYQASLLSNAIFFCGWHLCELEQEPHRDIRRLVLMGCAQAQKPLVLKAFGIQDLSYNTFVSVARMTYSVFAVFYQMRG